MLYLGVLYNVGLWIFFITLYVLIILLIRRLLADEKQRKEEARLREKEYERANNPHA